MIVLNLYCITVLIYFCQKTSCDTLRLPDLTLKFHRKQYQTKLSDNTSSAMFESYVIAAKCYLFFVFFVIFLLSLLTSFQKMMRRKVGNKILFHKQATSDSGKSWEQDLLTIMQAVLGSS